MKRLYQSKVHLKGEESQKVSQVKQSLASPESELLWKSLVWQPLIRRVQVTKFRISLVDYKIKT